MSEQPPELHVPLDLALVPLDELRTLETAAVAEFERLEASGDPTADTVERALKVADDLDRVREEIGLKENRAAAAAAREAEQLAARMKSLAAKVTPTDDVAVEGEPGAGSTSTPAGAGLRKEDIAEIVAAAARGTAAVLTAADGRRYGTDLAERVSTSLADAARHAPESNVPAQQLVVTASVDIPGVAQGSTLEFDDVVDAFHKRARNMSITDTGNPDSGSVVVTVRNQFEHTIDDRTPLPQVQELINYLVTPEKQEALVAGGGWCAPSEIRYDFFNIAGTDVGTIDLPTFGVSRGGIQFPVSPSLADAQLAPFVSGFSNTSNPWLWTETDDQATVTGVPNKPCVRVPCPSFSERRLECYGICLTAGNLTNDAYPEATGNFLRLLMAAHAHAMNARTIATMVGLSSAAIATNEFATAAADPITQILGGIELGVIDYRERYGMDTNAVLEVVVPRWVKAVMRAALRHRQGVTLISEADAYITSLFSALNVRAQFVGDWQVRGAGQFGNATAMTAWPVTVDVMIYAAGTFIRGNGLTLDLGVDRKSVV